MRKRLEKIQDDQERQAVFARRKRMLLIKAMELSVLCDCEVGIVMFNSSGALCQYSSQANMEQLLTRFSAACTLPHERHTNEELLEQNLLQDEAGVRIRAGRDVGCLLPIKETSASSRELIGPNGQLLTMNHVQSPGFLDGRLYPVGPASEAAYDKISAAFDQLISLHHQNTRGSKWDGLENAVKRRREDEGQMQGSPSPFAPAQGGGKRFKNLNITVPDNPSHNIVPAERARQSETGEGLIDSSRGANGDQAGKQGQEGGERGMQRMQSINLMDSGNFGSSGGLLSLPSPSNALFSMDGLFTSRGGLNLDLPTPDSTRSLNLDQITGRGLRWPSPSPSQRSDALPGFSDDGESGEELPGGLVVTGKAIKHIPEDNPALDIPLDL